MKVFSTATAVVLAASAQTSSAINCFLNVDAITTALYPIIQPAYECQTATGFAIVPPTAFPTTEQLTAVCAKCPELVTKGKDIKFPDCTVTIKGEEVEIEKLFATILGQCGGATETSASNSTTPAANSTAPAATTTAPATTTTAPAKETGSASSAAADKSSATVETPAPTTKAPAATTAAPKSAAAGVSATVGAAVAVAFSVAALVL